jgi:hypothetical protein
LRLPPAKAGYWKYNGSSYTENNFGNGYVLYTAVWGSGNVANSSMIFYTDNNTSTTLVLNDELTPSWTWVASSSTDTPPATSTITFTLSATLYPGSDVPYSVTDYTVDSVSDGYTEYDGIVSVLVDTSGGSATADNVGTFTWLDATVIDVALYGEATITSN